MNLPECHARMRAIMERYRLCSSLECDRASGAEIAALKAAGCNVNNLNGLGAVHFAVTLKPVVGLLAAAVGIGWFFDLFDVKRGRR